MQNPYPLLIETPFPILTPRLLIRPSRPGDGPAFNEAVNSSLARLGKWLPWANHPHTHEESENTARRHETEYLLRENFVLPIFDRNSNRLLGGSGLHRVDWSLPKFEIGYWIREGEEGKGIVSEAVIAITRYAFQKLKAKRVEIRCAPENLRSRAIPERLGFQLDGCLRLDTLLPNKELSDSLIFSRLNDQGLPALDVFW